MVKLKIGLIGAGKWGQNLLRVFDPISEVKYFSNRNKEKQRELSHKYPHIKPTLDYHEIIKDH